MKTLNVRNAVRSLQIARKPQPVQKRYNHKELYELLDKSRDLSYPCLLSIIIPVYNEENTIPKLIEQLPRHEAIETIIVDDHSTDHSLELLRKAKLNGSIHIFEHKVNQGYGAALLTGIYHSRGKLFLTMDSDGQHNPYDIVNLVKPISEGEADITIGSRYKGSFNYELPLVTRFGEALLEVVIRFFFWQKAKNNQSGFRAFHRKTYRIFESVRNTGYAFTTELILSAVLHDYRIKEVPIDLKSRKHGTSYIVLYKLLISLGLCVWLYILKNAKRLFSERF
jgi:glycosyltransferase involved in cell wall biosynthesis